MRAMTETRVYLVRHAEAVMNTFPELVAGLSPESELTKDGRVQPEILKRRMARLGFVPDAVYVSEAVRTQQTARIALGKSAHIAIDPRLNEMSQGGWEGSPRDGLYTKEALEGLKADALGYKARHIDGDGESKLEVAARMLSVLEAIRAEHAGQSIMAFTHRIAIACATADMEGWPEEVRNCEKFPKYTEQFGNVSATLLKHDGADWSVAYKGVPAGEFRTPA